jgi:hypothetical protein
VSIQAIVAVLDFAPDHWSSGVRMVAIAMADRVNMDEGGRCWPSVADIGRRTGLDRRTVQRHLRYLEQEGWIKNHGQRPGTTGGQPVSNMWTWEAWLNRRGGMGAAPRGDTSVTPLARDRGGMGAALTLSSNHKREPLANRVGNR